MLLMRNLQQARESHDKLHWYSLRSFCKDKEISQKLTLRHKSEQRLYLSRKIMCKPPII